MKVRLQAGRIAGGEAPDHCGSPMEAKAARKHRNGRVCSFGCNEVSNVSSSERLKGRTRIVVVGSVQSV